MARARPQGKRRVLDPVRVVRTLDQLHARIEERFPGSGLGQICADLAATGARTTERTRALAQPYIGLKALTALIGLAAIGGQVFLARLIDWSALERKADTISLAQGLESAVNLSLLAAGAIFFLARLETRLKRSRALKDLYDLRAFAHVIDMHQLTKDPAAVIGYGPPTASSPRRAMSEFELLRYLDYCSELLALTSKLAALYAARSHDPDVVEAVNDVENLTSNLGRKIWQKITILSQFREDSGAAPPPLEG